MKKLLKCLFCLLVIFNSLFVGIKAEENSSVSFVTNEPIMPASSSMTRGTNYSRNQWVSDIIEYNEQHYHQEVSNWYETEDMYVFEFETCNAFNTLSDSNESNDIYLGIDKIEYIKPESDFTLNVNGITYVDKFTYYYGLSGRYESMDSQSRTTYQIFKTLSIKVASTIWQPAGELMEFVTGIAETLYDFKKPASIEVENQYFYYNKVCSIRASNDSFWYPTCQIGKRYAFTKETYSVVRSDGFLLENTKYSYQWDGYSKPPKYGQFVESLTKPHYDDGRWMIEKAISTKNTGGYVDVYGLAPNPIN